MISLALYNVYRYISVEHAWQTFHNYVLSHTSYPPSLSPSHTLTVTTEVQQAVILLSPDSSTANVTCHFAAGSTTSGCLVTIDRGTITNITIPREPGSLVAQGVIPLPPSPLGELVFAVYSYDSDGMMSDISGPVRVETSDQTTELPGEYSWVL